MPHRISSKTRLPALSRRAFTASIVWGFTGAAARPQAAQAFIQKGLAAAAPGVNRSLVNRALLALAQHNSVIWSRDVVAIADFGLPSSLPRLHLISILHGTTISLFVTHGKGSDPDHTGYVQSFSDGIGSNATAEGAYLTSDIYTGVHGLSRRLVSSPHRVVRVDS